MCFAICSSFKTTLFLWDRLPLNRESLASEEWDQSAPSEPLLRASADGCKGWAWSQWVCSRMGCWQGVPEWGHPSEVPSTVQTARGASLESQVGSGRPGLINPCWTHADLCEICVHTTQSSSALPARGSGSVSSLGNALWPPGAEGGVCSCPAVLVPVDHASAPHLGLGVSRMCARVGVR